MNVYFYWSKYINMFILKKKKNINLGIIKYILHKIFCQKNHNNTIKYIQVLDLFDKRNIKFIINYKEDFKFL